MNIKTECVIMNKKSVLIEVLKCLAILILVILTTILFQPNGLCSTIKKATAFIHVNLIPMDGGQKQIVENQTVVISDGIITAAGPAEEAVIPANAMIIEGSGTYLMPGLADMHMHLRKHWTRGTWPVDPFLLYLANGVTTIRCFGPSADEVDHALKWKDDIRIGKRIGPQIFTCGKVLDGPVEFPTRQVLEQHEAGFDFIKLYSYMSREEFEAIMAAAKQTEMYAAGHIPFRVGLDNAIAGGLNEIAHIEELIWELVDFKLNQPLIGKEWLDEIILAASRDFKMLMEGSVQEGLNILKPRLESIAAKLKQADIPVCTTLNLDELIIKKLLHSDEFLKRPENIYLPASYFTEFRNNREKHQRQFKGGEHLSKIKYALDSLMLKALKKAGVDLLLSSDAGTGGMGLVPGLSIHDEIKTLIDNGFTPYEAIAAGTATASKIIGRMTGLDDFGMIQVGKRADLLLLEANPLADTTNLKKIKGVMAAGKYYDRKILKEMISVKIPIEAAIHGVHEPGTGLCTYLDVIIGKGFPGDPARDIETIIVNGPNGQMPVSKNDFKYFGGSRDYWLRIPGSPKPGEYTVVVKGAGMEGRAHDVQNQPKPIPLMDQTQMKPSGMVNTAGTTFSWQAVSANASYYYQLEIRHASGRRIYRSPIIQNMISHAVPNDFLKPGASYRWRLRVTDHENFVKVQNRAQSSWIPLTMADKIAYRYQQPFRTGDGWATSTLNNEGVAQKPIYNMMQKLVDKVYKNVDSILLIKNGKLILEEYFNGYHPMKEHLIASTTKSITSMLFGIAVDKNMIPDLNIPVYRYFPEYKGTPWIDKEYDISLRHMLTMTAGLDWDEITYGYTDPKNSLHAYYKSQEPVATLLRTKKIQASGSRWNYNSGLTVLLGEVIRKASGLYPDEFAEKYLFGPIGIDRYRWLSHPDGPVSTHGDLFMIPRDMAKIGQVMIDQGRWQDRRILSEHWVRESTRSFIDTGRGYGYGYQWRQGTMNVQGRTIGGYWASGMGGQKIYIFPAQNLVVVFTSKVYNNDMGHDLNDALIVNHIMPAVLGPVAEGKAHSLSTGTVKAIIGNYRVSPETDLPENALDLEIQIRFKKKKLIASTPFGNIELFPQSDNRFYGHMNGLGKFYINIITDKQGKVIKAYREIGFRRIYFDKINDDY
ncbi:serine hydrolase [Desulfobacula sp.]|uniref:serine hydrolase n=1 Tax=Desulfobacula sp. TaxID=2593537 RepID=UPI00261FA9AF|nr:serine hydrolase [Desulfobacula sp.]